MKRYHLAIGFFLIFILELCIYIFIVLPSPQTYLDSVEVNELLYSLKKDWDNLEEYENTTNLDFVILNDLDQIIFKTKDGLSENMNQAIQHRDTILTIEIDNKDVGTIILYNTTQMELENQKKLFGILFFIAVILQFAICFGYLFFVNLRIVKPFKKLKGFAEAIALGDLDSPLEMDKRNIFGAFTESFDIMRSELKKARLAEAQANISKKELVAKISHDIKTPIASIKAVAEVGFALSNQEKEQNAYQQIIYKADQINVLVSNLFTSTLEELKQLNVASVDKISSCIEEMILHADYQGFVTMPEIPKCMVYIDQLRLQQVLDNIIYNSYKYANTKIEVNFELQKNFLQVRIEDYGKGIAKEEIPFIKEKYKRGSNSIGTDGAGLGLYVSDYYMNEMHGDLLVENGNHGLCVTLLIPLSGTVQ